MPALHDIQAGFVRAVMHGEPLQQVASGYASYSAETALEVYRNNWRGNLHDALSGAYPVIAQLVGAAFFRRITREYISLFPSRSGDLHRYGEHLADFIAGFEPAQGLPYLSDVAVLEWACHRAYFAVDAATLDVTKLAQVPTDRYAGMTLQLHPACYLIRSRYPIAAIWQAHQCSASEDFHIDLDSGPCNALVSRSADDIVHVSELSDADADWLRAIQSGRQLGDATDATLLRHPEFNLQFTLLKLVTLNVLTGFSLETTT